jgi:uncharacterized protein (TIGR02118 family)
LRLPHLTREAFQHYWLNKHAPLVRKHQGVLGISRYVQLHSLDPALSADIRASRGGPEQYDGVAQLWWASFDALAKHLNTPSATEAGRELLEDERKFIDLARSPLWWGEEKAIVDERFVRPHQTDRNLKRISINQWPKGLAKELAFVPLSVPEAEARLGGLFERSWDDLDYFDAAIVHRDGVQTAFIAHLGAPSRGITILGLESGTVDQWKAQLALATEALRLAPSEITWHADDVR